MTSCPWSNNFSHKKEPRNPAPPVTKVLFMSDLKDNV